MRERLTLGHRALIRSGAAFLLPHAWLTPLDVCRAAVADLRWWWAPMVFPPFEGLDVGTLIEEDLRYDRIVAHAPTLPQPRACTYFDEPNSRFIRSRRSASVRTSKAVIASALAESSSALWPASLAAISRNSTV